MKFISFFKTHIGAILSAILLSLAYQQLFMKHAFVELDITSDSVKRTHFALYWQEKGMLGFDEQHVKRIKISSDRSRYQFFFTDIGKIKLLRVDPSNAIGTTYIKKLVFKQPGYEPLKFETAEEFAKLHVLHDLNTPMHEDDKGLKLSTSGTDSQLSFTPEIKRQPFAWVYFIHFGLLIAAFLGVAKVLLSAKWVPRTFLQLRFLPYLLVFVIAVVLVMVSISGIIHPDEYVHLSAVQFYAQHFLPPAINDPSIADTYSVYGYSRVNSLEIYYNIVGLFLYLAQPLIISDAVAARLFNVLLLIGLCYYSIKLKDFRYFVLPLLISAQAWYIFSYVNSEAFALVLAIILSYQAAYKQSTLNLVLYEDHPSWCSFKLFALGMLCGMLLLTKINFYLVLFFLVLYLLWRVVIGDFPHQARLWRRMSVICLVGVCLYGARLGWDVYQNGFGDRNAKLIEQSKYYSKPQYHPDTPLEEKNKGLNLIGRGVPFKSMLTTTRWPGKVFYSSFGSYGYSQYYGSEIYYDLVRYLCLMMLALILFGVLIHGPPSMSGFLAITIGSALLLITIAMWQSWVNVFQAQGRYLLPILPMMGVLYYQVRSYVKQTAVILLTLALFLLASYSFIFIGLLEIEKLRYPLLTTF